MFSKIFIVMITALVAVNALGIPIESGIPGITECIKGCTGPAAVKNGCGNPNNVACICTSAQFQADAGACIQQNCSAADVQTAANILNAECSAAGLSPSGSETTTTPPASGTPTPTSST